MRIRGFIAVLIAFLTTPFGVAQTPAPALPPTLKIHFVDVGQGDSVLIQTPSPHYSRMSLLQSHRPR